LTFTKGNECTLQLEGYGGEIHHEFGTEVAAAVSIFSLRNDDKLKRMGRIAARITGAFESIPLRWRLSVF